MAAAEYLAEGLPEQHVQPGKLRGEDLLHVDRQPVDDPVQLALRPLEVVLLPAHEGIALAHSAAERPYFPAQLVRAFACGGRVVKRLRKRSGRCGCQLVAFPHPAEELCLLSLQLSCAVFQTRGLALHAEDLLACVLCVPTHGSPPFLDLLAALSGLF